VPHQLFQSTRQVSTRVKFSQVCYKRCVAVLLFRLGEDPVCGGYFQQDSLLDRQTGPFVVPFGGVIVYVYGYKKNE
jgi:hypothetical protein